jgi:hypothetical protein
VSDLSGHTRFAAQMTHPAQFVLRPGGLAETHLLGTGTVPHPILAQIVDIPGAKLPSDDLRVELKITPETCGRTLPLVSVLSRAGVVRQIEDAIAVPLCGTSGDILVLKNLLSDLTLAAPR